MRTRIHAMENRPSNASIHSRARRNFLYLVNVMPFSEAACISFCIASRAAGSIDVDETTPSSWSDGVRRPSDATLSRPVREEERDSLPLPPSPAELTDMDL